MSKHIITLSDPVTKKQYKKSSIPFEVSEVRDYGKVTGYVTKEKREVTYMLIVKGRSTKFIPRLYYLDVEGSLKSNPNLRSLLDEDGSDFSDKIEATLLSDDKELQTKLWYKKADTLILDKNHKVAEYTSKDKDGINICLIDWKGDNKYGKFQVWYGQQIKPTEFHIKTFS